MTYKEAKLSIESVGGVITIDGWAETDGYWNGWSYVIMNKENALKLVSKMPEALEYDEKTEEISEVFDPNQHESKDDVIHWVKFFNEDLNEHVYSVGSGYWTWTHELVGGDIKESFRQKMQGVYGALLSENGIESGDIEPMQLLEMEDAEDKLSDIVERWIQSAKN